MPVHDIKHALQGILIDASADTHQPAIPQFDLDAIIGLRGSSGWAA